MKNIKNDDLNLLNQLKEIMPKSAYGPNATMFAIALEGWRRGLKLKFFTKTIKNRVKIRYTLSSEEREIPFQLSLAEIVPKESRRTTRSKAKTKEILIENNVSTPRGGSFNEEDSNEDIVKFAQGLDFPLIVKPTNGSLGIGVITGIENDDMLKKALVELRGKMGYKEIIMEQEVTGDDTRLFVVGDVVYSAFKRIAPNITGDGKRTIRELIESKNKARKDHPHMNGAKITMNESVLKHLEEQGLTLESVLEKGNNITLDSHTFTSDGAEIEEVTEELTEADRKLALQAANTLPGLTVCGVDVMIDREKDTRFVLELNSRPNINGSLFPWVGTPKNISKGIVDFYFPESVDKKQKQNRNQFYFDFDKISSILHEGIVKEVIVPKIDENDLIIKQLIVTGKVQGVGFRKWVQRTATGYELNGFVKNIKGKRVQLVIGGQNEKVNEFIETVRNKKSKAINVENIQIKDWKKPVKIGFEIKTISLNNNQLNSKVTETLRKNNELDLKLKKLQQRVKWMENSKSWVVTSPLRKLFRLIK